MHGVGEQLYFRSDDGKRFGLVQVVGYALFFDPFHPIYRVNHPEDECERFVDGRHLSPLTAVGALKAGSR